MRSCVSIMLKPVSGMCNMRCSYCFYADETGKREVPNYGLMSEATLEHILEKTLKECSGWLTIAFQGGEPTLAGLGFYRNMTEIVRRCNVNQCRVEYAFQTNGLLLDREWCRFFAEHRVLVGVSMDGMREIHDANRRDAAGRGTHARVQKRLELLKKHRVDFNILTVLTPEICDNYRAVYGYYRRNGWDYQQYIPCLDPIGEVRGGHPWSLTPEHYRNYLFTAFDCWFRDLQAGRKSYHGYFDNLLLLLNRQPPTVCGMSGTCGMEYVVEADGSVYPCDFYMLDAYRIGNFNEDSLGEMDTRRKKIGFIEESMIPAPQCRECRWGQLCRGGCRRDRDFFTGRLQKNYYCEVYQEFFAAAYPGLIEA